MRATGAESGEVLFSRVSLQVASMLDHHSIKEQHPQITAYLTAKWKKNTLRSQIQQIASKLNARSQLSEMREKVLI